MHLPILQGRLSWVAKYDPSEHQSHIRVLGVKHIYYASTMNDRNINNFIRIKKFKEAHLKHNVLLKN